MEQDEKQVRMVKSKRSLCPACGKYGLTKYKALRGTNTLERHCQFCDHQDTVTHAQFMSMRAAAIARAAGALVIESGMRIVVRHDALYEDGIVHRHRGVAGVVGSRIDREQWIVSLDGYGPICMHISNLDAASAAAG